MQFIYIYFVIEHFPIIILDLSLVITSGCFIRCLLLINNTYSLVSDKITTISYPIKTSNASVTLKITLYDESQHHKNLLTVELQLAGHIIKYCNKEYS